jgi:hypothetical protein
VACRAILSAEENKMLLTDISPALVESLLRNAPRERDPRYSRMWQKVSVRLQKAMRRWIPVRHFRDAARYENRGLAYQVLVYSAARPFYGKPKTEFTFDPADPGMTGLAMYNIGAALKAQLRPVETQLCAIGMVQLGRRYSTVWTDDILREVKKTPKALIGLLAAEAKLINAVIDLGTSGDVRRFLRAANSSLRNVLGESMRDLAVPALEEAVAGLLEQLDGGVDDVLDAGANEGGDVRSSRSPNRGIGGEEDRDGGDSHRGGKVRDAGIVADIDAGRGKPAGQMIQVIVADGVLESIFGSGNPLNRTAKPGRGRAEMF